MKKQKEGFTLPEIMMSVSILAILISIALPNITSSRYRAINKTCQSNLSIIKKALEQYMVIEGLDSDDDASGIYLTNIVGNASAYIEKEPLTPIGSLHYTVTTFGANPTCPNRDADPADPHYAEHILP